MQTIEHIYIHIPLCRKRCYYCSFYSKTNFNFDNFLLNSISKLSHFKKLSPKTIYFGGGTPSLLSIQQVDKILKLFDISKTAEITLEANPEDITQNYANNLKSIGINRVSLGIQSFVEKELKILGRRQSPQENYSAYNYLRKANFKNISLDLIYGLPQQKQKDLEVSLDIVTSLKANHISTYLLSLDKDVPLYKKKDDLPSDRTLSKFYYYILEKLKNNGFLQYEISNWAKRGYYSRHNYAYWSHKYYLGFGIGACSFFLKKGEKIRTSGFGETEKLTRDNLEKEFIFLSLRKVSGLNLLKYQKLHGYDFQQKYGKLLKKYSEHFTIDKNYIKLKKKSYFVSDEILSDFF